MGEGWEKQSRHTIPREGEVRLTREPTQKTGTESSLEKKGNTVKGTYPQKNICKET